MGNNRSVPIELSKPGDKVSLLLPMEMFTRLQDPTCVKIEDTYWSRVIDVYRVEPVSFGRVRLYARVKE